LNLEKRSYTPEEQLAEILKGSEIGKKFIEMRLNSYREQARLGIVQIINLDEDSVKEELIREIKSGLRTTILRI
jgi:hypothetical protein